MQTAPGYTPADPDDLDPKFTSSSHRVQWHARRSGWDDQTYYGDTDWGLTQVFVRGGIKLMLTWDADDVPRTGQAENLNHVHIYDGDLPVIDIMCAGPEKTEDIIYALSKEPVR